jgi:predicted phage-related endonuclease
LPIERHLIESREQWLSLRQHNVNASEVAIVCGEGAYGSLAELYVEKKGMRPPKIDTAVLRRGRWGEAAVFEALAEERPEWEIRRAKIYYADPELRIGATPDGMALAPGRDGHGIIQAKVIARSVFKNRWLDDASDFYGDAEAPPYYVLQTLTEAMLTGAQWAVIAVLVTSEFDFQLRLFEVERDAFAEQRIIDNVQAFWRDYFDPEIMPPFDPQRDEALIRALYPRDAGTTLDLTQDNRALVVAEELTETRAGLRRLTAAEKALRTEIAGKLGSHTYGLLGDGRCLSFKHQHRRGYTVAPGDSRVLRVLRAKPQDLQIDDEEEEK